MYQKGKIQLQPFIAPLWVSDSDALWLEIDIVQLLLSGKNVYFEFYKLSVTILIQFRDLSVPYWQYFF